MNTTLDISAIQTFDEAIRAYDELVASVLSSEPTKKCGLKKQITSLIHHVRKTFSPRQVDLFCWEIATPGGENDS